MPTHLIGDPGRIRQVLTNLVGNAVKFTSEGHVLVRVTGVSDAATGDVLVKIAIEDTGIGIAPSMIDHIFGEFNQVENERNRKFDGTGLGLAICQRLIQLMEGDIWVTSQEQVGSCFGFEIPLKADGEIETSHPPLPKMLRHVMVVEAETINRSILIKQLEQLGLKVTCFDTAEMALEQMTSDVDLIISDHIMANIDGFDLAVEITAQSYQCDIIIVSSNPALAENDPARKLVKAILKKPIPRSDLLAKLAMVTAPADSNRKSAPRRMRILAAEDNKTNQLVFSKMIQSLDIDLKLANNGEEAVALFETFEPDMIFMDISMPKMDGKEATAAIRRLEGDTQSHCPIVALTAHAMDGDDAGILAAGLDHYLTKPLRKPDIVAQVLRHQPVDTLPLTPERDQQAAG
jgi:CheY-like chemotaxis protein